MEALACGLPVISTDVGAIPEMLGSGSCGVIAEPGDIGAFSEAIVGIASNFDLRAEMSLKARRIAERKFSSEKNYAALIELLRKHGSHK
jgi:glycosyltransferase involved in cell wall biosynthesis